MLTALSLGWPVGQQAAVITLSVEWWVKCWKVRMYVEVGSISNSFRAICLAVSSKFSYSNRSIGLQKAWNLISRIWWLAVQLSYSWANLQPDLLALYTPNLVHIDTGAGRGISICCSNYFHSDWQKLQELPAIAMLLLAIGTRFIHESPRFLAARGRTDEAGLGRVGMWLEMRSGQDVHQRTLESYWCVMGLGCGRC